MIELTEAMKNCEELIRQAQEDYNKYEELKLLDNPYRIRLETLHKAKAEIFKEQYINDAVCSCGSLFHDEDCDYYNKESSKGDE